MCIFESSCIQINSLENLSKGLGNSESKLKLYPYEVTGSVKINSYIDRTEGSRCVNWGTDEKF